MVRINFLKEGSGRNLLTVLFFKRNLEKENKKNYDTKEN